MKKLFFILFLCTSLISCKNSSSVRTTDQTLDARDMRLQSKRGSLFFNDQLFTGITEEKYPDGKVRMLTHFKDGKEEGVAETFYENGEKESHRIYTAGEKDSIHTGWFPGGKMKFEYHFSKGNYDGAFREWYPSGAPAREMMYANGKELSGKEWRENGVLYTNFIWKGNRRYGVVNANMCYGVEKGKVVD